MKLKQSHPRKKYRQTNVTNKNSKEKRGKKQQQIKNTENMDVYVNLKRRKDSGDSATEEEKKTLKKTTMLQLEIDPQSLSQLQEKKLKSNAQPNLFPAIINKYTQSTYQNPPLPNITFSFPCQNSKNAFPVPLGDQRINTIIIINNINQKKEQIQSQTRCAKSLTAFIYF